MDKRHTSSGENILHDLCRLLGAKRIAVVRLDAGGLLECVLTLARDPMVVTPLADEPVSCPDLKALGVRARADNRALIVDNTLTTAVACPAVRLGAHVSVEPLGAGMALVGLSRDVERALPGIGEVMAALPQVGEDELCELGDALGAREALWHETSDVAQVVATYLVCHPRVEEVHYPGLKTDASFEVAARTLMGGFGPFVSYRVMGEEAWHRLCCRPEDPRELIWTLERRLKSPA